MIKLTDNYVIQADDKCYTLAIDTEKDDAKGKRIYKTVGYYNTVAQCIEGCYRDICRKKVGETNYNVKEALEAFRKVECALKEIMPKEFK